ncbi:MAG: nuclear transport factor 2 family protein [Thermodesulfovibrionales bacterium]
MEGDAREDNSPLSRHAFLVFFYCGYICAAEKILPQGRGGFTSIVDRKWSADIFQISGKLINQRWTRNGRTQTRRGLYILITDAVNPGDLESQRARYEAEAKIVHHSGPIVGRDAVPEFLKGFLMVKPNMALETKSVDRAGDIALLPSTWHLIGTDPARPSKSEAMVPKGSDARRIIPGVPLSRQRFFSRILPSPFSKTRQCGGLQESLKFFLKKSIYKMETQQILIGVK